MFEACLVAFPNDESLSSGVGRSNDISGGLIPLRIAVKAFAMA
jgi:hypothetical protein